MFHSPTPLALCAPQRCFTPCTAHSVVNFLETLQLPAVYKQYPPFLKLLRRYIKNIKNIGDNTEILPCFYYFILSIHKKYRGKARYFQVFGLKYRGFCVIFLGVFFEDFKKNWNVTFSWNFIIFISLFKLKNGIFWNFW